MSLVGSQGSRRGSAPTDCRRSRKCSRAGGGCAHRTIRSRSSSSVMFPSGPRAPLDRNLAPPKLPLFKARRRSSSVPSRRQRRHARERFPVRRQVCQPESARRRRRDVSPPPTTRRVTPSSARAAARAAKKPRSPPTRAPVRKRDCALGDVGADRLWSGRSARRRASPSRTPTPIGDAKPTLDQAELDRPESQDGFEDTAAT